MISGCFEEEKKSKKPEEPENGIEYPPIEVSALVEDRGTYFRIEIVEVEEGKGIIPLTNVNFKLFNEKGLQQVNISFEILDEKSIIYYAETKIYPFPSTPNTNVYENQELGDGDVVDEESLERPELWEGCYLTYVDSPNDAKIFYGDSIWIYKDWNNDNIDDISEDYYLILEDRNEMVLRKNLTDDDGPFEKASNSLNINDKGNYLDMEILNKNNISFNTTWTYFQIYTKNGVLKLNEFIFIDEGWPDRRFVIDKSTYHIYGYKFDVPYENSTNGSGEKINIDSLNRPEIWEGCVFIYVDYQSDNYVNTGDFIWLFKDWNDDNVDDVIPTDRIWIFDKYNEDMVVNEIS